jgi:hypothetical protein
MVPAIQSTSLPAVQPGERLPTVPTPAAFARAGVLDLPQLYQLAVQLDPRQSSQASRAAVLADWQTAAQAAVQDAPLPPRRRAVDSARAPGFPTSPYVAQVLAQEAFPPTATAFGDGLAAYRAAAARGGTGSGNALSLHA